MGKNGAGIADPGARRRSNPLPVPFPALDPRSEDWPTLASFFRFRLLSVLPHLRLRMAKKTKEASPQRRNVDQRIAELAARIVAIRTREAQRQAKADPAKRHIASAVRALDKALAATEDPARRRALSETRAALGGCLEGDGGVLVPLRNARSASEREALAGALLDHVRAHPDQRGEQIAAALGTDTTRMRPVMKQLIAAGRVRTAGQRRGMTYSAT